MIGIIDYGMGNLRSVQMGFTRVGAAAQVIQTPEEVRQADKLVLPGVGAFADAIANLRRLGLAEPIVDAIGRGRPFLGICLGLQLLFETSCEDGEHAGLGVLPGRVVRFRFDDLPAGPRLAIPHMGWNQVTWNQPIGLLDGVPQGSYFYFVHSYYVEPRAGSMSALRTDYGRPFVSGVARGNLLATQFHPEKSQATGMRVLANFARL